MGADWQGGAGLKYGSQNYKSGSDFGKELDDTKKQEYYKILSGEDFDPFHSAANTTGFSKIQDKDVKAYQNLFEPVYAQHGFKGTKTGEMKLKTPLPPHGLGSGIGNAANNEALAASLKSAILNKAYDKEVGRDLYEQLTPTEEEYKAITDKWGEAFDDQKWEKRKNKLTGEEDWVIDKDIKDESNFYRKYKKPIIQTGAGILGFALGGPAGALEAATLAGTIRDIYAANVDKRKLHHQMQEWQNEQAAQQAEQEAATAANRGNVYRGAGEGVVEYATNDLAGRRRGTYVRGQQT